MITSTVGYGFFGFSSDTDIHLAWQSPGISIGFPDTRTPQTILMVGQSRDAGNISVFGGKQYQRVQFLLRPLAAPQRRAGIGRPPGSACLARPKKKTAFSEWLGPKKPFSAKERRLLCFYQYACQNSGSRRKSPKRRAGQGFLGERPFSGQPVAPLKG
jgi:hypothetical protein